MIALYALATLTLNMLKTSNRCRAARKHRGEFFMIRRINAHRRTGHLCDFGYFRLVHVSGLLLITLWFKCKSTQVNPSQPKSTQVNPSRLKSTQVNPSRPKSTQVDPSQPKLTQVNPSRPKSTRSTQVIKAIQPAYMHSEPLLTDIKIITELNCLVYANPQIIE
ncbi:hypothetical protein DPMN_039462 [Dreissena polymorpha]|uniref:Uncharacterized protein n=1 Tax=Dreissena polymorpha TaxID=45954 RepID=A0A9D4CW93_DREPO|nr:hypothetical protein DPMN_039462 [Dreissena polymorpha]